MPPAKPRTLEEIEKQKQAVREFTKNTIAAARKEAADKIAALKSNERRLRAQGVRDQKKRENHAKILVGVAMIHQCKISEASAAKFKAMLDEFYADSPERLNAAHFGLTLTVKKPDSDAEQD